MQDLCALVEVLPVGNPSSSKVMTQPPPSVNREAIIQQIIQICQVLPSESLLEVLNFAIHELARVLQAQQGETGR